MEVDLQLVEHKTGQRTQTQREDDLHQRLHDDAERVDAALFQRVRHAERGREEDEADGVVDGDDHQQQVGQRAVGLVLLDDHQGRGRGRGRCDRTQRDGRGHGDDIRAEQVQDDQCEIHQCGGDDGLQDADRDGLPAHAFQRGQTKFVADDEGNEAQRHLGDEAVALHLGQAPEADAPAAQAETPQKEGPQQQACHQIRRHSGQVGGLGQPRHQKPRDQCEGQTNE